MILWAPFHRKTNRGFAAIAYVLLAIALSAALAASLLRSTNSQIRLTENVQMLQSLQAQAQFITTKISECATLYPSNATSTPAILRNYPSMTVPTTMNGIEDLECPGLRESYCSGNTDNQACAQAKIFSSILSSDTVTPPDNFADGAQTWLYRTYGATDTDAGVALELVIDASYTAEAEVLSRLARAFTSLNASYCNGAVATPASGGNVILSIDILEGDPLRCP